MYEHLDKLAPRVDLLDELKPLSKADAQKLSQKWPKLPEEYLQFLIERGFGGMEQGYHFTFLEDPLDAVSEVFKDDLVISNGAKGPVCVFGHDQSGGSFGFDMGDDAVILQIDQDRIPVKIALSFKGFVEELLNQYPQIPS